MPRSQCYCTEHSCELTGEPNNRFQYDKEDNIIVNGGFIDESIDNCPIRKSREYQNKPLTKILLGKYVLNKTIVK